jgi:hypothetical protein
LHPSDTGQKWEYNKTIQQLFINFKEANDSVRREALYSSLIDFGVPIKAWLNEACNIVRTSKHLSNTFPSLNDLKQGDALSSLLLNFTLECAIGCN